MKMRFRTDGWHYADLKVTGMTFEQYYGARVATDEARKYWDETPKAEPGDVWRIHWHHHVDGKQVDDWIAGYAICCPGCSRVHNWTTALNCATSRGEGKCVHNSDRPYGSCWNWTGSAEEGTLSATPSLQVVKERCEWGCGWHGYITNGDLHN